MQLKKALQVILDQKALIEQQEKKIDWLNKSISKHTQVIKELMEQ